jgi:hypothetical protein
VERGIRISSFSAAVYSNHKQGGDYNERAEGKKGKDGEGRHTDCDGGYRRSKQHRVLYYLGREKQ